jgi:thiol-disulfide isomerase/thioredoxin
MTGFLRASFSVAILLSAQLAFAQASESTIAQQIHDFWSVPEAQQAGASIRIAHEIQALPASASRVELAENLSGRVTEGDQGVEAEQIVANTLASELADSPPQATGDQIPMPYLALARLVHYEHVTTTLNSPLFKKAMQRFVQNDAAAGRAQFTLRDLQNNEVTFSALRGKIVLVNFWATWCGPCLLEMPDLDAIYTRFQSQGLVVLSITADEPDKVRGLIAERSYHPSVLLDPDGKVQESFHTMGLPESFVFNRERELVAVAVDQRTQRQFLVMLAQAGLKTP